MIYRMDALVTVAVVVAAIEVMGRITVALPVDPGVGIDEVV